MGAAERGHAGRGGGRHETFKLLPETFSVGSSASFSPSALVQLRLEGLWGQLEAQALGSAAPGPGFACKAPACPGCQRTPVNKCCIVFAGKPSDTPLLSSPGRAVNRVQAWSLRSTDPPACKYDSLPEGCIDFLRGGKRHIKLDFPTCFE